MKVATTIQINHAAGLICAERHDDRRTYWISDCTWSELIAAETASVLGAAFDRISV
jgi:hypothetical protein